MPGCVLRVSGADFQPQSYLQGSGLAPCNVFRKGERKAEGRVWAASGFTVVVSEAPGDDLGRQIRDAVEFMRKHRGELARLMKCEGLKDARLDFGVSRKGGFVRSSYLPPELLALAGELNIGVEVSVYGEGEG